MKKSAIFAIFALNFFVIQVAATPAININNHEDMCNAPNNLIQLLNRHPDCEFLRKLIDNYEVFVDIYKNCNYEFEKGCGSYLFDGVSYEYCEKMYEKQKLLYETAKKCDNFLEIGVYMGHSIFIALLANPNINITCIDINDQYTRPALDVISKKFNKKIDFIKNDSALALPQLDKKFDMFHIDAWHSAEYLTYEFSQCINKCCKKNVFFVVDDYDAYPDTVSGLLKDNNTYSVVNYNIPVCSWRNIVFELRLN